MSRIPGVYSTTCIPEIHLYFNYVSHVLSLLLQDHGQSKFYVDICKRVFGIKFTEHCKVFPDCFKKLF